MKSHFLSLVVLAGGLLPIVLLFGSVVALEDDEVCDLKKVEKGYYCESCDEILDKASLVSDHVYYVCPECEIRSSKGGKCLDCEKEMSKKKTAKNACKACFDKAIDVEVCIKTFYECPECKVAAAKAGKCSDCVDDKDKPIEMKLTTSKALVEYYCEECGMSLFKAGKCTDKECKNTGKPLTKCCSDGGNFPHVKAK
jgi:hypothetical protein